MSPAPTEAAAEMPAFPRLDQGAPFVLRSITMVDGLNGWARAESDGIEHLLNTEDGGRTWLDVSPPETASVDEGRVLMLTGSFRFPFHAYVTFYQPEFPPGMAKVWQTADGGYSWFESAPVEVRGLGEFYQPWLIFTDQMTGWYLAQSTTFGAGVHSEVSSFHTFDGGASWSGDRLSNCWVTGMDANVFTTGWVSESCLGPYDGVVPTLWVTEDGGSSWSRIELATALENVEQPDTPLFCETHSPRLVGESSGGVATTCYENEVAIDPILNLFYTTADNWTTFNAYAYPGGPVIMADESVA